MAGWGGRQGKCGGWHHQAINDPNHLLDTTRDIQRRLFNTALPHMTVGGPERAVPPSSLCPYRRTKADTRIPNAQYIRDRINHTLQPQQLQDAAPAHTQVPGDEIISASLGRAPHLLPLPLPDAVAVGESGKQHAKGEVGGGVG